MDDVGELEMVRRVGGFEKRKTLGSKGYTGWKELALPCIFYDTASPVGYSSAEAEEMPPHW